MKQLLLLILSLLISNSANAEILQQPKEICNMIMIEKGFEASSFKPLYLGSEKYYCQSQAIPTGSGISPNEIIYSASGSENGVKEVRLNLTVYSKNGDKSALAELENLGGFLVQKITGQNPTSEVKDMLIKAESNVIETDGFTFEIEKDIWDTGKGYSVIFKIR